MARPKKHSTDAERKAADAERKRLARLGQSGRDPALELALQKEIVRDLPAGTPPEPTPAVERDDSWADDSTPFDDREMLEFDGPRYPRVRTPAIELEVYLENARIGAELALTAGASDLPDTLGRRRVQRAVDYASWRYRGFEVGVVVSL